MNDEKLKAMWSKAEKLAGTSDYKSPAIEQFISGRSNDAASKIRNMIILDIALKTLVLAVLIVDFVLFWGTFHVMVVTVAGAVMLIPLLFYQKKLLNRFTLTAYNGQSTRDKLASMLTYLKTRFFTTLLLVAITYLFGFIAGSLAYFYAAYGYVRQLDGVDVMVFLGFIVIGILFNFLVNRAQVNYQIKHLELCLSDLNENNLALVSENIELQRKQDRSNKILLALVVIVGFVLLVAVFMNV
ncbi:hypothetical protein INQ51_22350 [Maribellus sp. CM-23]|uniref:hypothetical protein n=1 Tax=Maribellus sp. CM-23 TaxID=2781026 RepID=UPI001F28709C|nr:hypothetical protein [Maribellus sp. CM-23]MCE4567080.1 hypothetical protein [Maribellus sp. CM-23]